MANYNNTAAFCSAVIAAAKAEGSVRLFLDVESAGLHAAGKKPICFSYDAFVYGVHVASFTRACLEGEMAAQELSDAAKASGQFDFFGTHVLPKVRGMSGERTCRALRDQAWTVWDILNTAAKTHNFKLELWGDVIWPVETAFFSAMVADGGGGRDWVGPCPMLDVASVLAAQGFDAFGLDRFAAAGMDKSLQHHPRWDNVASHAVLVKALNGTLTA
ncbi:MAG: hypothetical protein WAX89_06105 [Alphaproteobacteria bacterium]